jgi:hypothetical protein
MSSPAFQHTEIPVARSMLRLACQSTNIFARYICTWISFNNVYTTLWYRCRDNQGAFNNPNADYPCSEKPTLQLSPKRPREWELIDHAFAHFSTSLKETLVLHPSTDFFVNRTPRPPRGLFAHHPNQAQHNGVLKVGDSTPSAPEYQEIDVAAFNQFQANTADSAALDVVADQVLDVLYAVRNNTFHGGKQADDAQDVEVVERALPLVQLIVRDFWADPHTWPRPSRLLSLQAIPRLPTRRRYPAIEPHPTTSPAQGTAS